MNSDPVGHGWLARFLVHPGAGLHDLAATVEHFLVSPSAIPVALGVAGLLAIARVLLRARRARLGAGARHVTILTPPEVDSKGALAFWAHLIGQLRPPWRRVLFGQPHLGFEYTITPQDGAAIRLWVPGSIPPGLIERAVASAWPGAHTHTEDAGPPLPSPDDSEGEGEGARRLLAGGELRLGSPERYPLRTEYHGDLVRDLITAADDLAAGQAACVQILARPVTGRRVARATGDTKPGLLTGLAREVLNMLTPGPATGRGPRPGGSGGGRDIDRQTALQVSAADRAAAAKAKGPHWETVVRYAVSVPAEPGRQARAVARGRADALATVFGASTDHNYYRRRRQFRLAQVLSRRQFGRGDLLSVPELAGIAHLPAADGLPGLQRAGARALPPAPDIPVGGEHTKPLGVADSASRRPVAVRVADARHHMHVLGPTGVGKSTLLAQMILADADAGRGQIVVDPKGDLVTDVLSRLPARLADKVVLFDADSKSPPPCVNPLDLGRIGVAGLDLAVDNLVAIFHRIFAQWWGPRTDDVMRASLLTLCAQPGTATLADLPRLLTEPAFRARVTRTTTDPVLRGFWEGYEALSEAGRAQVIGLLMNKLRALLLRPFVRAAVAAGPATLEFADILDNGGICLARLPKGSLGEETSRLVGSLLVARTWQAATARARQPSDDRADASLVLDEAQNFLNLSTPVEDMLAEARGLRLSLVLAHQNLAQLTRELRDGISANARNKVIFAVSPDDARDLARHTSPWLTEHDLTHLDAWHAAARLLVAGKHARPFTLTTRPLGPPVPGRAREIAAAARTRLNKTPPTPPTPAQDPTSTAPAAPASTDLRLS
ncbi:type IV secretory system conjugative DNA transfer family protein [Nocardia aurantiaca]|uniref:Type IV secretion system DNA-binding domain-containing protein n=1 Tax=Nocardia aurantiaca TaxID=2675850 RepID=A0A6I3L6C3_9NOCA|nr:type IV secretion system DNA-binding domain-containing protein [Nocardia aurantiaca]